MGQASESWWQLYLQLFTSHGLSELLARGGRAQALPCSAAHAASLTPGLELS